MARRQYNSDQDLVDGVIRNHEIAMSIIYKSNFPTIRAFIINNSGNEVDAKDIFQESFMILVRNIREGRFKGESKIKTYLYSICRRQWLKELGKRKKFVFALHDYEEFVDFAKVEEDDIDRYHDRVTTMNNSLAELGEPCGELLKSFYLHNTGIGELTRMFGYKNDDSTKNQKYKCMQRLRKVFFSSYQVK